MSGWQLVRLEDCMPQPWRNGGGQTRELLAWPRAQDWQVRVSVARIEHSGPFSPYPGVRRWFAVLDGAGVRLALPHAEISLTPQDTPLAFDGEDAPMCQLLDGPTQDLNLMTRRGAGVATLGVATAGSRLEGDLRLRALFAAEPALLDIEDRTLPLQAGTLLWSDEPGAAAWTLRQGRRAFWLTLEDA
jgi:hypothetical protein